MSAIQGIISRFEILSYYLKNSRIRQRTAFREVLDHVFSPRCETITKDYASLEKSDKDYSYYKIKGYDRLFHYPASAPFHNFAQVIAESLQPHHWHHYEIPETKVAPGDVIVDCGSAEGFFAFKYQDIAKKIYCIEPLPLFVNSLNCMFNGTPNVEVMPYALGSEPGTLYMELNDSAIASNCSISPNGLKNPLVVKSFMIDNLFAEKDIAIDYLKADLEGFEEEMIKGALQTIKLNKPKIAITTYHTGQNYQTLIALIKSVVPEYKFKIKGIENRVGNPVMLHMWV